MGTKDLIELMERRRSIRDYEDTPVTDGQLENILKAATLPPTGADRLPFVMIRVTDQAMKQRIREEAERIDSAPPASKDHAIEDWMRAKGIKKQKDFLTQAPVLLVVAGDTDQPYWQESTWLSIAYIILAIESEGLTSLTYTPRDMGFLNRLLEIPDNFHPEVILPVGHPKDRLPAKGSRPEGKVFSERYGSR